MKRKAAAPPPRQQTLHEMRRVSAAEERARFAEGLYEDEHSTFTRFSQELEDKWSQRFDALAARACVAGVDSVDIEAIRKQSPQEPGNAFASGSTSRQSALRWFDDGGLRRRFELINTNHVMEGVFHLDGVFERAARYRSCHREDWWILKKGDIWRGCGHPRAERCTQVLLPGLGIGKMVDGIEEIPDEQAGWQEWAPGASFCWVSDAHCGYERSHMYDSHQYLYADS